MKYKGEKIEDEKLRNWEGRTLMLQLIVYGLIKLVDPG